MPPGQLAMPATVKSIAYRTRTENKIHHAGQRAWFQSSGARPGNGVV
jgi:hypothetical protein